MAHLILTGATGLVGSAVLVNLIARPASEVSKVTILSRREVPVVKDNPRFETVIQKDFGSYDADLLEKVEGASGVIWAQGISITQVPREYVYQIVVMLSFFVPIDIGIVLSSTSSRYPLNLDPC